ncbi:MAG: hypothetical protein IT360_19820 [Gemmatimonadaceae bacterium]|jgi:hypothetical protein|nr:hypothetical protein [Gemmatimonadaceae bacterium]
MTDDDDIPRTERKNVLLRLLIDDMLEQVRDLQKYAGPWPADERASAEAALERIMVQVRQEALRRGDA